MFDIILSEETKTECTRESVSNVICLEPHGYMKEKLNAFAWSASLIVALLLKKPAVKGGITKKTIHNIFHQVNFIYVEFF